MNQAQTQVSFVEALAEVRESVVVPGMPSEQQVEYIRDPERDREAEAVDLCVRCLCDYELWPPAHGPGVGRYGPVKLKPPLGRLIGRRKIEQLPEAERRDLAEVISTTTAVGYLAMTGIELDSSVKVSPQKEIDPAEMWSLWIVRLSGALDEAGMPRDVQHDVTNGAEHHFVSTLRQLGRFPRLRKRMRYRMLGKWYGQAGMVLRLLQTLDPPLRASDDVWQLTNQWPFEQP